MTTINDQTASDASSVTPSDTTNVSAKALYVGGGGDVAVVTEDGTTVTFSGVPAGSILPIRVQKVNSTNTTATSIVALT